MKHFISLIVCFVMITSCMYAVAETDNSFDNTQFEGLPGYSYSKMDRTYRYEASFVHEYSDAYEEWTL